MKYESILSIYLDKKQLQFLKFKTMRLLKKITYAFCFATLGLLTLTGCEGADLYDVNAPDWISDKIQEIAVKKIPYKPMNTMICIQHFTYYATLNLIKQG